MPLTEQSSSVTDVVAVGPGWRPRASRAGWLQLPGCCHCKGFFAAPQPSPSTNLFSFSSSVPLPCSPLPPSTSLLLVLPSQPHFIPTSHSSLHNFNFLTLKLTGFISEKLNRRGKATSVNFLDHFSIGEYNNYFSPFLFFLLRSGAGTSSVPSLAHSLHKDAQCHLQVPTALLSLVIVVQVSVGLQWGVCEIPTPKVLCSLLTAPENHWHLCNTRILVLER